MKHVTCIKSVIIAMALHIQTSPQHNAQRFTSPERKGVTKTKFYVTGWYNCTRQFPLYSVSCLRV